MKAFRLLSVAVVLGMSVSAFGAVAWTNPSGTADLFTWANGQNETNNFGSPTNIGDTFIFFTNFDVGAPDGLNNQVSQGDTMDVDLAVRFGTDEFAGIMLTMYGDYSIGNINPPADDNSVEANFDVSSTKPLPSGLTDTLNYFNNTPGAGSWTASAAVMFDTVGGNVQDLHLTIDGNVIAISDGNGGTASITANTTVVEMDIIVIPEPASLSLLALGGLVAIARRRR